MTAPHEIEGLLATARALAQQSRGNPSLASKLLSDPTGAVAEAAGRAMPSGVTFGASKGTDGTVELKPIIDGQDAGALDDAALDSVSGGFNPHEELQKSVRKRLMSPELRSANRAGRGSFTLRAFSRLNKIEVHRSRMPSCGSVIRWTDSIRFARRSWTLQPGLSRLL